MDYTTLTQRLALYLQAEAAIVGGAQEYQIGNGNQGRRMRRADLAEIRQEIKTLQAQLSTHPDNPNRTKRRGFVYLRPY